jgi:hypothetical protein
MVGRLGGGVEVRLVPTVDTGLVTGTVVCGAVNVRPGSPADDDVHAAVAAAQATARNVAIVALDRILS